MSEYLESRIAALEAVVNSLTPTPTVDYSRLGEAVEAARKGDSQRLVALETAVRELRSQLTGLATKGDLTALNNKLIDGAHHVVASVVADESARLEAHTATAVEDATRAVRRDAERAAGAAMANLEHAKSIILAYSAQLGA